MGIFSEHFTHVTAVSFVYLAFNQLALSLGCANKQFNSEKSTEHFEFKTTIPTVLELRTYVVVYNGVAKALASFYNGSLFGDVSTDSDVTLTGSVSTGDFSFTLSGVSTAKTGVYTLYGANAAELSCVKLYILRNPNTPALSSGPVPGIGRSLKFTCSSSSTTVPNDHGLSLSYTWSISGQTDPTDSRYIYTGNTLTISNVQRTDRDKPVSCSATEGANGVQKISDTSNQLRVDVHYGPDTVILTPSGSSHTVDEGEYLANIVCHADCNPACTYVWRKKYQASIVRSEKTLPLGSNIRRNNAGEYTCTATSPDGFGTPKITIVNIFVIYGPDKVILQPPQQTYTNNELETLDSIACSADCYPSCTVKWMRNSKTYDTNILNLGDLDESEAGNYTCIATNTGKARSARKVVTINVRYGPKSVMFTPSVTSPLTLIEGVYHDPISCSSNCYPSCSASWKKETQTTSLARNDVLSLGNVNRSYTGHFTCTSTNDATQYDKSLMRLLTLVVQYPPDAVITLKIVDPREIVLKCLANGEPPNYDFENWIHIAPDGFTEIQRYAGQVSGGESSLVLKNVTYMDSGVYTCKVSNTILTGRSQFGKDEKELHVADKPFVIQDPRVFIARITGNVAMSVKFYSHDAIKTITWMKIVNEMKSEINSDGYKYTTSVTTSVVAIPIYTTNITLHGNKSELTIRNVSLDDYTEYEVRIENSRGDDVMSLVLKPTGPPEIPTEFASLQGSATSSSIGFTWVPGFYGGADQTFHIEYRSEGYEWKEGARLFSGKVLYQQLQADVNGLDPGSSYLFRIFASNKYGQSDKSVELLVKTIEWHTSENGLKDNSNTVAVAGWVVAGVLGLVVIIGLLLLRLRKNNRLPVCKKKHERTTDQKASRFSSSRVVNTESADTIRSSGNVYDELNTGRESVHLYSGLQGASNTSSADAVTYSNLKMATE